MARQYLMILLLAFATPVVAGEFTIHSGGDGITIITIGDNDDTSSVTSNTTCEVERCGPNQLRHADDEMNRVYARLKSKLKAPNFNQLRDQQRSWLDKRDRECGVTYKGDDREKWLGHLVSDDKRSLCVMRTTRERTSELVRQLRALANISFAEKGSDFASKPQKEWARAYWEWSRGASRSSSPADDETGRLCGERQSGAVWFLSGSNAQRPIVRRCEVPAGTPLVIPVLNVLAQGMPGTTMDCTKADTMLRRVMDNPLEVRFSVDGIDYSEALRRVITGCFKLNDVGNSIQGNAFGDGLWAFLEPLPPGEHKVTFGGRLNDGFWQDVTYQLKVSSQCVLPLARGEADVVAVGRYSGLHAESIQLGDSGHQVNSSPVVVNRPGKPVVLVLMSYDPTWWQVALTPGTQLKGVVVAGYHTQAVTGISRRVPLIKAVHEEPGSCPYFYAYKAGGQLDQAMKRIETITHQPLQELVTEPSGGRFVIGSPDFDAGTLIRSNNYELEDFPVKHGLPAGQQGIEHLVKEGKLRRATQADIDKWVSVASEKYRKLNPKLKVSHHMNVVMTYVVLAPVTLPTGMYGGHLRTFLIPKGVPKPKDPGSHNSYYYIETGLCEGVLCGRE